MVNTLDNARGKKINAEQMGTLNEYLYSQRAALSVH